MPNVYSDWSGLFQFTPLREGRPSFCASLPNSFLFQFTPLREGRRRLAEPRAAALHFNSRPSARGDASAITASHTPVNFNSRPSARGDSTRYVSSPSQVFQFTPLREGRRVLMTSFWRSSISIHAPPRGATRAMRRTDAHVLFQFTPLREGRRAAQTHRLCTVKHFNSRPSARGDDEAWVMGSAWVFQFTPLREGRRTAALHAAIAALFQFTPLREGRRAATPSSPHGRNFNSRPSARGDARR